MTTDQRRTPSREPNILITTAVVLTAVYLVLEFVFPWLAIWIGIRPVPAPLPTFAMVIYMLCAVAGAVAYIASDDRRLHYFLKPLARVAALAPGRGYAMRLVALLTLPLVVGWVVWRSIMPGPNVPTLIRLQHPTLPQAYASRSNPLPNPTADDVRDGLVLYQKNCRPCHGAAANGDGPLARGLRLRPVDFTDGGTIASVVEAYPFWRIADGAAALPDIATPWNSAMPSWGSELTEEEIWRIVMTEYRIAGTEPRRPEGGAR